MVALLQTVIPHPCRSPYFTLTAEGGAVHFAAVEGGVFRGWGDPDGSVAFQQVFGLDYFLLNLVVVLFDVPNGGIHVPRQVLLEHLTG